MRSLKLALFACAVGVIPTTLLVGSITIFSVDWHLADRWAPWRAIGILASLEGAAIILPCVLIVIPVSRWIPAKWCVPALFASMVLGAMAGMLGVHLWSAVVASKNFLGRPDLARVAVRLLSGPVGLLCGAATSGTGVIKHFGSRSYSSPASKTWN